MRSCALVVVAFPFWGHGNPKSLKRIDAKVECGANTVGNRSITVQVGGCEEEVFAHGLPLAVCMHVDLLTVMCCGVLKRSLRRSSSGVLGAARLPHTVP
jgi:hypothetical protein